MKISVDFTETFKMFNDVQKNEFPFATSKAMNFVMKGIVKDFLPVVMDRYIDRGATRYTKGGFFAYYTMKNRLSGFIAAKDKNEYLDLLIFGGQVKPLAGNNNLIQPVNQRKNKYGNIPRNTIKRKKSNTNLYFFPKKPMKGKYGIRPYGLYRRYKKKSPKLIIKYDAKGRFQRPIFPADRDAARYFNKNFIPAFDVAMKNAVMSSKYRVGTGF